MIYYFTCKTGHSEWLPTCLRECLIGVGEALLYCANGDFFYPLKIKILIGYWNGLISFLCVNLIL